MSPLSRDLPLSPRGEGTSDDARLLASLEQIIRHVLHRTESWKVPLHYSADYWREERESIARVAVWQACVSYDPSMDVPFAVYAFYSALQAIRREHRLAWRWSRQTTSLPLDESTGEETDFADAHSTEPFDGCETTCDLQRALGTLSDAERTLLAWWCDEELTEREIAKRLNLSKTAVHKRLVALRQRLQKALAGFEPGR